MAMNTNCLPSILLKEFDRMDLYFHENKLNDVTFIIKSEERKTEEISANKAFLTARSIVFDNMFKGDWLEKDSVTITDISYNVFKIIIQFIYTNGFKIPNEIEDYKLYFSEVMYAARKYELNSFVEMLCNHAINILDKHNVCFFLDLFNIYENTDAQEKCKQYISKHTDDILSDDSFNTIKLSTLKQILDLDLISITEHELLNIAMKWAEAECIRLNMENNSENKRKVLGDAHKSIRFHHIKNEEFEKLCQDEPMFFNAKEILEIKSKISRTILKRDLTFKIGNCSDPIRDGRIEQEFSLQFLSNVSIYGIIIRYQNMRYNSVCSREYPFCWITETEFDSYKENYSMFISNGSRKIIFKNEIKCNANEWYYFKNHVIKDGCEHEVAKKEKSDKPCCITVDGIKLNYIACENMLIESLLIKADNEN